MRRARDFYPTPAWATRELLKRVSIAPGASVLEVCAGAGDIADPLRRAGLRVVTNDIDGKSDFAADATQASAWARFQDFDWVITNPPFSCCAEIVTQAFEAARVGVAMLLRLSFLEPCENRADFLVAHPPTAMFVLPRISFTGDGNTDTVTCAWFVWRKGAAEQELVVVPKRDGFSTRRHQ